jgi:toxin ParE1/3/4
LAKYSLSNKARADLKEIARYTFKTWGIDQAHRYNDALLKCLQMIADTPLIGRPCNQVHTEYRRIEHARHVVFYRPDSDGVFIGRILHQRMLPTAQVIDASYRP